MTKPNRRNKNKMW